MSSARGSAGVGGASAMGCQPGSVRCDGNWVVHCEDDGTTSAEDTCAFACVDGQCSGSCTPKTMRCIGQERQRCDETGNWQTLETCGKFCAAAACAETCAEGSRQCDGSSVMRCSSGRLIEDTVCGFVCDAGACSGECLPGSRRCADGAAASCAADGMWSTPTPCANACVEGACTGTCTPGAKRCAGTAAFQACTELGQWGANQACAMGACFLGSCSGVCTPGAIRCDTPSSAQTCEVNGQWGASKPCSGSACTDGHCGGGMNSACPAGSLRCDPSGVARVQTCSVQGTWQTGAMCASGVCRDGTCAVATAGTGGTGGMAGAAGMPSACAATARRCDPIDVTHYQTCSAQGTWSASQACPQNATCVGQGECPVAMSCPASQGPDWYSPAQSGGNPKLDDPRWGNASLATFARTFGFNTGGYFIVLDRASAQLAVSVRVTMGPSETPLPNDYVYFGATPNLPSAPAGRSVAVPLLDLLGGEGPKPIMTLNTSVYKDGWQSESSGWVQHASAWRGGPDDGVSWAVSFRVDLAMLQIDPSKPFRIALAAHAEGATSDLTTPAELSMLTDMPGAWALAVPDPACVGRVLLKP